MEYELELSIYDALRVDTTIDSNRDLKSQLMKQGKSEDEIDSVIAVCDKLDDKVASDCARYTVEYDVPMMEYRYEYIVNSFIDSL